MFVKLEYGIIGSRYVEGCWGFPYWRSVLVSWCSVYWFLVSWFLVFSWFQAVLALKFLGFLVSKFLGFKVIRFKVSKIQ